MRQHAFFELLQLVLVQRDLLAIHTSFEHETWVPGILFPPSTLQRIREYSRNPIGTISVRDNKFQEVNMHRRDFMKLAGIGGVVFASGLGVRALGADGANNGSAPPADDFYFVQLSDTHWGFDGPAVNPDSRGTLKKAIATVNSLEEQPDFIVFTGDLTHITEDSRARRDRMTQFRDITGALKAKTVHYMAGEHDASLDRGDAFQELFGKLNYTFDHKGVHFIVIDNVSDPSA